MDVLVKYTVIGLVDHTTQPTTLTVAGVVQGLVWMVDNGRDFDDAQRWSDSFDALDPDDAEVQARAQVAGDDL